MFENGWLARSFALCSHKNAAQPMLSKENVSCLQVTSFEHRIASEVASFRSFDVTKYSTQILKAKKLSAGFTAQLRVFTIFPTTSSDANDQTIFRLYDFANDGYKASRTHWADTSATTKTLTIDDKTTEKPRRIN